MTYLFALLSSGLWGTADFIGGRLSRDLPALWVVAASQACSLALLAVGSVAAVALGVRAQGTGWLGWGVGGGVALTVGLASFYRGLAIGRMGVVAPIASTGVAVPVAVGFLQGDRPVATQAVGIAVAVVGVLLAGLSSSGDGAGADQRRGGSRPIVLALVAGVGFGAALVCLQQSATSSSLYALTVMRAVILALLVVPAWRARPTSGVGRGTVGSLVALGVCDVGANAMFSVASLSGSLALVAVLSSLYPVVTTLLARQLLHERLSRWQLAGVVATLGGTVLIVL